MRPIPRITLLRATLVVTTWLTLTTFLDYIARTYQAEMLFVSRRYTGLAVLLALLVLFEAGLLVAAWTPGKYKLLAWLDTLLQTLKKLGRWNTLLFVLVLVAFAYFSVALPILYLNSFNFRLLVYWLAVLCISALLRSKGVQRSFPELFAASLLLVAVVYKVAVYLPELSTYPFSLGWSETSRYYYASLFFSEQVYGIQIPPSVLHPTRYLMQAVPFLIPDSPLWLHRLWQVFLWLGTTFLTSYLLTRRLAIREPLKRWVFLAWSFLFLLIGPVYYHLQVTVIIVLLGYDRRNPWKTFAVVLLASIWAGISRINWFPVPGMLAATIYFLEESLAERPVWRYLLKPVLWVGAGTLVAFTFQTLYAFASGNPVEQFSSSFTSDLLWYRLLPNPTYPMGVLPAVLLVSSPLLWVIIASLARQWKAYHLIRWAGILAILLVLLGGGLVVSTKIGGGSNLHNLDAYLTLLLVVGGWCYYARTTPDLETESPPIPGEPAARLPWIGLLYILLLPVYITLLSGPVTPPIDRQRVDRALAAIDSLANAAYQSSDEVLFISERQLLTYGLIRSVPLVPEYEKVFLMEMAMANNPGYLGQFHQDLKNQRFALIVSEPLAIRYKGRAKSFGEENDAWVKNVAEPILCYYEPFRTFRELKIQLLKPRSEPESCTLPFSP